MSESDVLMWLQQHQQDWQVVLLLYLLQEENYREYWERPILLKRETLEEFKPLRSMYDVGDESFKQYFHMNRETFNTLLKEISPLIEKANANWRNSISSTERFLITLRYLATGDSQSSIAISNRVGKSTVSKIINETCSAVCKVLMPKVLKPPTGHSEWKKLAEDFHRLSGFPMCIGAMDGKYILIKAPINAKSEYHNDQGIHKIVLLAVCDAQYCFRFIDIGDPVRHGDGGIFANSNFGKQLLSNQLGIPPPECLDSVGKLPFCFVADAAFPLKPNIMRPYPGKNITKEQKIFNYRLSRARRVVENSFGIFSSRWRIFRKPIIIPSEKAVVITKAACCLHNYLQLQNKLLPPQERLYCPPHYIDSEDQRGNVIPGRWRSTAEITSSSGLQDLGCTGTDTHSPEVAFIRKQFTSYFTSIAGQLPWQFSVIHHT